MRTYTDCEEIAYLYAWVKPFFTITYKPCNARGLNTIGIMTDMIVDNMIPAMLLGPQEVLVIVVITIIVMIIVLRGRGRGR